jgi:hypothetical protein
LQGTASDRSKLHNLSVINGIFHPDTLPVAAMNCTDYRNQHAPEHAPEGHIGLCPLVTAFIITNPL